VRGTVHPSRLATAVVAAVAALLLAPAALGHAVLERTDPSNDAVLESSPATVSLGFSEAVESALGAIRVFDANGERVDDGTLERPSSTEVAVGVEPNLPDGTYTVAWRVVSADSHPVAGAFVFHVGAPGANAEGIGEQVLAAEQTSGAIALAFGGIRFLSYALLLLCAGGTAALALCLRDAGQGVRRALYAGLAALAGLLALASLTGIVLQAADATGLSAWDALRPSVLEATLETRFGQVWLARALLALVLAALALALRRRPGREGLVDLALLLCVGLVVSPAAAGHANVSGVVSFIADVIHVQAASVWVGGLAFVVAALLLTRAGRWELAARAVPRFSTMAVVAVAALVVAGGVNAYLQVRTWSGLWETAYGRLLLAKLALVLPLLALGLYNNRRSVPRLRRGIASALERRRFLTTAAAELTIMVAIVAVTAVLVETQPARVEQLAASRPVAAPVTPTTTPEAGGFEGQVLLGEIPARVEVDPALAGENTITLTLDQEEGAPPPTEVRVSASLPSEDIELIRFQAKPDPTVSGRYVVDDASLSIAGEWSLQIALVLNEFDLVSDTIDVPIGGS
jgi:copper transport protein